MTDTEESAMVIDADAAADSVHETTQEVPVAAVIADAGMFLQYICT